MQEWAIKKKKRKDDVAFNLLFKWVLESSSAFLFPGIFMRSVLFDISLDASFMALWRGVGWWNSRAGQALHPWEILWSAVFIGGGGRVTSRRGGVVGTLSSAVHSAPACYCAERESRKHLCVHEAPFLRWDCPFRVANRSVKKWR